MPAEFYLKGNESLAKSTLIVHCTVTFEDGFLCVIRTLFWTVNFKKNLRFPTFL
jgi:hypothetical protein